ncbi:hypothetical protein Ais01nite_02660 [Asanoa ishikariensis]|nr:hypothetical protein Ais01nite_02660 [Asanoa ishikariensis]
MSFRVDPDALDGFSKQVDRAGDCAAETKAYLGRHADAALGGEIYNIANDGHHQAVTTIDRDPRSCSRASARSRDRSEPVRVHELRRLPRCARADEVARRSGDTANPLGWMDLLSVSHWANEACRGLKLRRRPTAKARLGAPAKEEVAICPTGGARRQRADRMTRGS